ncbi:hypothetical protein E1281_26150 [Actinomadura sp. KC345]|uniref:alpha/beta hydrolase fold domain-containing protein n=1 Tax=Actinomadura sp. KC345 TaxID=2530371 RepID=UPI001048CB7C|nr:hypothetical protein E1281_26150 [Actinomadura sp. KC345]
MPITPTVEERAGCGRPARAAAWAARRLRAHRRMIARISQAAGMPVLSVAYRMQPKVTIRESIADCVDSYRWLLDQGHDADGIVVGGDSAGGYLAFMAPLYALRDGLPRPAGIAALSPFTDLDIDAKIAHANTPLDPFIPAPRLWDMVRACFPDAEYTDPWLCPVRAGLGGLPPTLIQAGSIEVLRADAELMAERLGAADVPCTLQIWKGRCTSSRSSPMSAGSWPPSRRSASSPAASPPAPPARRPPSLRARRAAGGARPTRAWPSTARRPARRPRRDPFPAVRPPTAAPARSWPR